MTGRLPVIPILIASALVVFPCSTSADDDVSLEVSAEFHPSDDGFLDRAKSYFVDQIHTYRAPKARTNNSFWRLLQNEFRKHVGHDANLAVRFYMYNDSSNLSTYKEIKLGDESSYRLIRFPRWNTLHKLKVLIHGFASSLGGSFIQEMKDGLLTNSPTQPILCVDWGPIAWSLRYTNIADNLLPKVATQVGRLLEELRRYNVVPSLSSIHLIGHSLGAHIAGQVGSNHTEDRIGRITGLDPAGVRFELKSLEYRLDETDATFVDVIHTSNLLGELRPSGHADFYPNIGQGHQPGCRGLLADRCDHHRAIDYYVKSLDDSTMFGCRILEDRNIRSSRCSEECSAQVVFGEHIFPWTRGQYCLKIEA